jgi:hypothetical protein
MRRFDGIKGIHITLTDLCVYRKYNKVSLYTFGYTVEYPLWKVVFVHCEYHPQDNISNSPNINVFYKNSIPTDWGHASSFLQGDDGRHLR